MRISTLTLSSAVLAASMVLGVRAASSVELTLTGCDSWNQDLISELTDEFYAKSGHSIVVRGGGSTLGIREVSEGLADLGCSARHKTSDPSESNAKLIPVAWDALVVIVHASNGVERITERNLQAVLEGRIANWADLGGADLPIELVVREDDDAAGLGLLVREFLFKNPDDSFPEAAGREPSFDLLEARVEKNEAAIGVSLAGRVSGRNVKVLKIGRMAPSYDTLTSGEYPLVVPLYVVVPKAQGREATQFVRFLKATEGQRILKRRGVVSLADGSKLWTRYQKQMVDARKRRNGS